MFVRMQVAWLITALMLTGCAEEKQPEHVKMFPGATNTIAPGTGYFLEPPPKGPINYYLEIPSVGQEPDGQLKDRQKYQVLEEGEEYVKITFGGPPDPGEVAEPGDLTEAVEAYIPAKFVPAGDLRAGTKVEVLETKETHVKIKLIDGTEGYVKPRHIKKIASDG